MILARCGIRSTSAKTSNEIIGCLRSQLQRVSRLSGPGVIAAVGNADGEDAASYQGDRRKLFQGRGLVVVRTSKHGGPIHMTATAAGLSAGIIDVQATAANQPPELR